MLVLSAIISKGIVKFFLSSQRQLGKQTSLFAHVLEKLWKAKTAINTESKYWSLSLYKGWQLSTSKSMFSAQPPPLTPVTDIRWRPYLALATAGSIHSSIQLWVAGCSYSAPQSAAHVLGKQREINVLLPPSVCFSKHSVIYCSFIFSRISKHENVWRLSSHSAIQYSN